MGKSEQIPAEPEVPKGALQYRCINCGTGSSELYKDYRNGIIKMIHCVQCSEIIDKYIEYDPVVISLDVLLLNRKALRHVLFNSNVQGVWKYVILLLTCDAFVKLALQRAKGEITPVNPTYIIYSAMEWGLYKNCLLAAVELSSLVLFICVLVMVFSSLNPTLRSYSFKSWKDISNLVQAVVLSNFGKFLVILAVLWGTKNSHLYIQLIKTYICAATVQTLRVCMPHWGIVKVSFIAIFGHLLSMYVTYSVQHTLFGG
ncbi:protein ARV1-like [Saccostrea echinata]|uniref:protein ARV1-like n=1 Tax=Saccostrea echinata TaxID=191078 RepID=UPI002A8395FD|nr:protein ARV1-like [Saccostrea echinata]